MKLSDGHIPKHTRLAWVSTVQKKQSLLYPFAMIHPVFGVAFSHFLGDTGAANIEMEDAMAIEIVSYRATQKNTLRGFFVIRLFDGVLEVRDLSHHEGEGRQWVNMPSRPYTASDGTQAYAKIVAFPQRKHWEQFQAACLEAIDEHLCQRRDNPSTEEEDQDDDTPF